MGMQEIDMKNCSKDNLFSNERSKDFVNSVEMC